MSTERSPLNRRQFMRTTAALSATAVLSASRQARSATGKLGVGVIGCGGRAGSHLHSWNKLAHTDETVEIVAVCDVYRPRMERRAEEFKAKGYMDHRELLADPRVDMVSIATPDHHHGHQAMDAIRAGKHVYCEKPVTHWRQFDVIKELHKVVKESDRAFQLGTQGMSDGAWHQMKALVDDGLIGQPIQAECGYFRTGDWGERGMPIDDPDAKPGKDLNWEAFLGDCPKRDFDVSRFFRWRMYEDYAGGPVTDLFPHSLTPVMHILGVGMPSVAVGTGGIFRYPEREIPDTFNMLIDFPEKLTIAVLGTQGNDFTVAGQRGAGQRIPVIRGWDGALTIRDEKIVFVPTPESNKKEQTFKIKQSENQEQHFRNLVDCAKAGTQNTYSDIDLAYHTQTALLMAMASLREGKVARFDAVAETIIL